MLEQNSKSEEKQSNSSELKLIEVIAGLKRTGDLEPFFIGKDLIDSVCDKETDD